jgi:hypothetical protein
MGPRTRKALASVITLVFLMVWIVGAMWLSAYVPTGWMKSVYLAVAGLSWGLPLFPLFTWAEHGRFRRPRV